MSSKFYDGTKLLSLKDINNLPPEIYICTSNRQAGKTTYFSRLLFNRFLKGKGKFLLIYRNQNELVAVADKFFNDIKKLFFNNYVMISKPLVPNKIIELFIKDTTKQYKDDKEGWMSCGYATALRAAPKLKPYSHLLTDTNAMFFDEFQPEGNEYLPREIDFFISLHTTVARGNGKQTRYVPVFMVSNAVTILNPYYTALGISDRLTKDTKFLRGDGWVMESAYNESASKALKGSSFAKAFASSDYMAYATGGNGQAVYLNDQLSFIDKPKGPSRYLATLAFEGGNYAVREYEDDGIIYVDDSADMTFPLRIAVSLDDHNVNWILLENSAPFRWKVRTLFDHGCCRFKNLQCKRALLTLLSY